VQRRASSRHAHRDPDRPNRRLSLTIASSPFESAASSHSGFGVPSELSGNGRPDIAALERRMAEANGANRLSPRAAFFPNRGVGRGRGGVLKAAPLRTGSIGPAVLWAIGPAALQNTFSMADGASRDFPKGQSRITTRTVAGYSRDDADCVPAGWEDNLAARFAFLEQEASTARRPLWPAAEEESLQLFSESIPGAVCRQLLAGDYGSDGSRAW